MCYAFIGDGASVSADIPVCSQLKGPVAKRLAQV
jgi:hypothetical protein